MNTQNNQEQEQQELSQKAEKAKNAVLEVVSPALQDIENKFNSKLQATLEERSKIDTIKNMIIAPIYSDKEIFSKYGHLCKEEFEDMERFIEDPYNKEKLDMAVKGVNKIKRLDSSRDTLIPQNAQQFETYQQPVVNDRGQGKYPKNTHEIQYASRDRYSKPPRTRWKDALNKEYLSDRYANVNIYHAYNEPLDALANIFGETDPTLDVGCKRVFIPGTCSGVLTDREKEALMSRYAMTIPHPIARSIIERVPDEIEINAKRLQKSLSPGVLVDAGDYLSAIKKLKAVSKHLDDVENLSTHMRRLEANLMVPNKRYRSA